MIQYSPVLLNRNVAPGIADFASADIPDLRSTFPEAEHWLSNHFLNTLLGPSYEGQFRQYAIGMLSRAQAQFALFHQAREATQAYLEKSTPHNPSVRRYFAAIALWESCFLNLQIFVDIYTKAVCKNAFEPSDGSDDQRAYDIANAIKHWGGYVNSKNRKEELTIPMWISNTGFHTHAHSLTYAELSAITSEVAKAANELQSPVSRGVGVRSCNHASLSDDLHELNLSECKSQGVLNVHRSFRRCLRRKNHSTRSFPRHAFPGGTIS